MGVHAFRFGEICHAATTSLYVTGLKRQVKALAQQVEKQRLVQGGPEAGRHIGRIWAVIDEIADRRELTV